MVQGFGFRVCRPPPLAPGGWIPGPGGWRGVQTGCDFPHPAPKATKDPPGQGPPGQGPPGPCGYGHPGVPLLLGGLLKSFEAFWWLLGSLGALFGPSQTHASQASLLSQPLFQDCGGVGREPWRVFRPRAPASQGPGHPVPRGRAKGAPAKPSSPSVRAFGPRGPQTHKPPKSAKASTALTCRRPKRAEATPNPNTAKSCKGLQANKGLYKPERAEGPKKAEATPNPLETLIGKKN